MLEQDGQSNSPKQSSDLRNVVNRGVDGILQLVFEYGAEFREGFVIGAWLVQIQFLRVNLVDSNVHVDVIYTQSRQPRGNEFTSSLAVMLLGKTNTPWAYSTAENALSSVLQRQLGATQGKLR